MSILNEEDEEEFTGSPSVQGTIRGEIEGENGNYDIENKNESQKK